MGLSLYLGLSQVRNRNFGVCFKLDMVSQASRTNPHEVEAKVSLEDIARPCPQKQFGFVVVVYFIIPFLPFFFLVFFLSFFLCLSSFLSSLYAFSQSC